MPLLRKWIIYSTLVAIFCTRFYIVAGGLTLYYFYFCLVINLLLLTAMGISWVTPKLRNFFLYLLASGLLGLLAGTNSLPGFLKSFVGVLLCALYSAAILRFVHFNAVGLFQKYAHLAFYAAILGLILMPLPFQGNFRGRVVSLLNEPSAFARTCVPALIYYAAQWQRNRRYGLRVLTLLAACVLTFSSLGIFGMMMGVIFLGFQYRLARVLIPVVVGLVFALAWNQSEFFQRRVSDTLTGFNANDVNGLNESSFGIVANGLITKKQFAEHPIFGGGFGSHVVAHANFIDSVPGAYLLPDQLKNLGEWDASSLFLRIVSELGLVGLAGVCWYLWHYYPRGGTPEELSICFSILCYIFMKFCRSGEYFGSEVFFMYSIYTVIGLKVHLRSRASLERSPKSTTPPLLAANPST